MKRKITLKDILILQAVVTVYTFAGVIGKLAAGQGTAGFLLLYGAEIVVLGIYALLWQQMIRKFELSVAYANRAVALVWSLIWASLFFQEEITMKKIAGVVFVVVGAAIINGGKEKGNED